MTKTVHFKIVGNLQATIAQCHVKSNKVQFKVVGNLQATIAHRLVSCQINSLQGTHNQAIKNSYAR